MKMIHNIKDNNEELTKYINNHKYVIQDEFTYFNPFKIEEKY